MKSPAERRRPRGPRAPGDRRQGPGRRAPPRHPRVGLTYPGLFLRIGFLGLLMGLGLLTVFNWAQARFSLEEARTITFCAMVAFEWFRAFNARSDEVTVFKIGFCHNRWLLATISASIVLQLSAVYLPFLQLAFHTVPLSLEKWGIILLAGGSLFLMEETRKLIFPRLFSLGKWQPISSQR